MDNGTRSRTGVDVPRPVGQKGHSGPCCGGKGKNARLTPAAKKAAGAGGGSNGERRHDDRKPLG